VALIARRGAIALEQRLDAIVKGLARLHVALQLALLRRGLIAVAARGHTRSAAGQGQEEQAADTRACGMSGSE
jgi:hypothetical protein